jgi:hypothetical protein
MSLRPCLFFVLAIALLPACSFLDDFDTYLVPDAGGAGGGGGGGTTTTDGAVSGDGGTDPVEGFLARFFDGLCEKTLRCEEKLATTALESFCHPGIRELFLDTVSRRPASIDPAEGEACLTSLESADCSATNFFYSDACQQIFAGLVPAGGSCIADFNCAEGRCEAMASGCGKVCVTKAGEGKSCDEASGDADCDGALRCRSGTCQPRGLQGEFCEDTADCAALLWCNTFGQCEPLPNSGEECVVNESTGNADPCRGSLVCTLTTATSPEVRRCLAGKAVNESCSADAPCASGLRCATSDQLCHTISPPGGGCVSKDDCPRSFECVAQTCVPLPGIGEACAPTLPCYQGGCVDGECAYLPAGSGCDGANGALFGQCSGYCAYQFEGDVCEALSTEGGPCFSQEACAPGLTCASTDGGFACLPCP